MEQTPEAEYFRPVTPDLSLPASQALATLHSRNAFNDASTSGYKKLDATTTRIDLTALQPGGKSTLHPAKLETEKCAAFESDLQGYFADGPRGASHFHLPQIAILHEELIAYTLRKGRVRVLDIGHGDRLLLQHPHKGRVTGVWAIEDEESAEEGDPQWLVAASTSKSLCFWRIAKRHTGYESTLLGAVLLKGETRDSDAVVQQFSWLKSTRVKDTRIRAAWLVGSSSAATNSSILVRDLSEIFKLFKRSPKDETTHGQAFSAGVIEMEPWTPAPVVGQAFSPDASIYYTLLAKREGLCLQYEAASTGKTRMLLGTIDIRLPPIAATTTLKPRVSSFNLLNDPNHDFTATTSSNCARAALIGFEHNTTIGLVDLSSAQWRQIWRFDAGGAQHNFNLIEYQEETATLLIANSYRSSVFAHRFAYSDLPSIRMPSHGAQQPKGGVAPTYTEAKVLKQRLVTSGALPWTVEVPERFREFALPQPSTSFAATRLTMESLVLHATQPQGVHAVYLPSLEEGGDRVEEMEQEMKEVEQESEQAVKQEAVEEHHEQAQEAVAEKTPSEATREDPPENLREPTREYLAQGSSSVSRDYMTEAEGHVTSSSQPKAPQDKAHLQAWANAITPDAGAATTSATPPEANAAASSHIEAIATRLESKLDTLIASATVDATRTATPPPPTPPRLSNAALSAIASEVGDALLGQLSQLVGPEVRASLRDLVHPDAIRDALRSAARDEVASSITDSTSDIVRDVARSVTEVVQRTAVEVVSKVLTPQFDETIAGVAQRLESKFEKAAAALTASKAADEAKLAKMSTAMGEMAATLDKTTELLTTVVSKLSVSEAQIRALDKIIVDLTKSVNSANKRAANQPLPPPGNTVSWSQAPGPGPASALSSPWSQISTPATQFQQPPQPQPQPHQQQPPQPQQGMMGPQRTPAGFTDAQGPLTAATPAPAARWVPIEPFSPGITSPSTATQPQPQMAPAMSPLRFLPSTLSASVMGVPATAPASAPAMTTTGLAPAPLLAGATPQPQVTHSSNTIISAAPTPAAQPLPDVEDELLTALMPHSGAPDQLLSILSRLEQAYGSPASALEEQLPSPGIGATLRVTQPVLLALLHRLAELSASPISPSALQTQIHWAEAVAPRLRPRDESVSQAFGVVVGDMRRNFELAWEREGQRQGHGWWSGQRFEGGLRRFLFS